MRIGTPWGNNQMKKILFVMMLGLAVSLFAEPVHPHLMFDQADIPVLREKIKSGMPKRAYDRMIERCNTKHLMLTKLEKFAGGDLEIDQKDPLFELVFAYILSGDEKYKTKFLSLLDDARKNNLDLYGLQYDSAMVFDMGYGIMGEENRKYLKAAIVQHADKHKYPNRVAFYPYSNWGMIPGLMGARDELVLYGHPEYNPEALGNLTDLVKDIFNNWIDDDGAALEGGSYLNYPWQRSGGSHVHMIYRKNKTLVDKTNLPKVFEYLRETEMPNGSVPHLADSGVGAFIDNIPLYALMHLLPENPIANQMALKMENNKWYRPDPMFGIILYQTLKIMSLPQLPLANYYPLCGIMCYKSAYDDPNAFYAITQSRYCRGHAHEDVGTFFLSAYGKDFVTESGYGEGELFKHNMVSINNQSPKANGGGGTVRQYLLSPHALVMNTNLSSLWNRTKPGSMTDPLNLADWSVVMAERSFIVLPENKALGIPPYVLVSDYVKRDERNQDYSWLLQTFPQYEIKISRNAAKIIADKDDLAVEVLTPNNAKLTASKWKTEYRFKDREFQRLEATVKDKSGRFLVALYPRTGTMPELKVEVAGDPFQKRLAWPQAADYLDWNGEANPRPYEFALFRTPLAATFTKELPRDCQYLLVNTNRDFKIGALPVISSQVFGGGQDRDREIKMSAAFDGDSLNLDIYTNELMSYQIPYLTEVKAFAPKVKQVICNGENLQFEQDGDYVTVRAYSRVIKSAAELRTPNNEKITRKIEQSFGKSPSIKKGEK
jgi:hypothetical protein